jgi:hypothetical protein
MDSGKNQLTAASLKDLLGRMGFHVESAEDISDGVVLVSLPEPDRRGSTQAARISRILVNLGLCTVATSVPAGILVADRPVA